MTELEIEELERKVHGRDSVIVEEARSVEVYIVSSPPPPLPPGDQGGMIFAISQSGGQLLKFKSQGGDTFMGGR